jgi:hypothetical protein
LRRMRRACSSAETPSAAALARNDSATFLSK